jgi:hypothetical protein
MQTVADMIDQLEREGYRVQLNESSRVVLCWLWRGDRIVAVGCDRTDRDALERVRKQVDEGDLL